jgi:glycosyltransferase involved in cell wall biosynthesis
MNILLIGAHSVLEHDEMALFHSLGHSVFSPGAYIHPSRPMDPLRPPLNVPEVPELIAAVDALGQPHPDEPRHTAWRDDLHACSQGHTDTLLAAKLHLPDEVIDWADVIMVSAFEHTFLIPEWQRLRHKRVIWRTIGQSGDQNEAMMTPLRKDGCQIVRYSPKEANIPNYAGADALIRFGKDPEEWKGWTGEDKLIVNVTQGLARRGDWCGYGFWEEATYGLPRMPMGGESEQIGGPGTQTTDEMKAALRRARAYVYTGTQPASYTLGMIEALMTGIPTLSIGPSWMRILPYGPEMFEGHELVGIWFDDPAMAHARLQLWLDDHHLAAHVGGRQRERAIETFGIDKIRAQWGEFLGVKVREREMVAA